MAYQRNGYWYRSVREGGHVRTEYIGSGALAALLAAAENGRRAAQTMDQAKRQGLLLAAEQELDRQFDALAAQLKALTDNALTASGYHKHSGTWRKKRKKRQ